MRAEASRRALLSRLSLLAVGPWLVGCASGPQAPQRASAQSHWSQVRLAQAEALAQTIGSAAVLVVQDGAVVASWGDVARRLVSFSVRKSLISALYGIAAERGQILPEQTLAELEIDDETPLTESEKQARVVDLLRARSGVYLPVAFESPRMRETRPARGSHPPGAYFYYNNWDFNVLGTIFERHVGPIGEAFARDVAGPIGMEDFRPEDVFWLHGPPSRHGAFQFAISTRDLARFGTLYLNNGEWNGRQIIPAKWVRMSTRSKEAVQFRDRPAGGYEYQWWVAHEGVHLPGLSLPGAFSARGAGGHHLLVIPSRKLVIVHRGGNEPASRSIEDMAAAGVLPGVPEDRFAQLVSLVLAAEEA